MLGVLIVIGVLSVAALAGFTYAMNRHKANETIHDVMLRATNVPMIDEYYVERVGDYEWKFAGLPEDGQLGSFYRMHTVVSDLNEYIYRVVVSDVPKRVCRQVLSLNPTDIDAIYVEGDTPSDEECPNELNTMAFYFDEYGIGGHLPNPDEPGPGEVTPPLPPPSKDCLQIETYYYGDNCEYTAECCADEDSSCPPTCTPKECPEPPQCNECEQYVYDNDGCPINCEAKRCEVTCEDSSLGGIDIDNCGCPKACACTEDTHCKENEICYNGKCILPECTTDEGCSSPKTCVNYVCKCPSIGTPNECQEIIELNGCNVLANKTDGSLCSSNQQTCQNGICKCETCDEIGCGYASGGTCSTYCVTSDNGCALECREGECPPETVEVQLDGFCYCMSTLCPDGANTSYVCCKATDIENCEVWPEDHIWVGDILGPGLCCCTKDDNIDCCEFVGGVYHDNHCCSTDLPYWSDEEKKCVECLIDQHCQERKDGKIRCNQETKICECPEDKPYFSGEKCVECLNNANCSDRTDGKTQCDMETYTCICPDDKPYFSGDICVECLNDAHCLGNTDGRTICDTDTHTCISGCISLGETCEKDNGEGGLCAKESASSSTLVCCSQDLIDIKDVCCSSVDKMVVRFNSIGCPYSPPNQYGECCEDGKVYHPKSATSGCCRSPYVWMSSGSPIYYPSEYCDIPLPDEYLMRSCCCPGLNYICSETGDCLEIDEGDDIGECTEICTRTDKLYKVCCKGRTPTQTAGGWYSCPGCECTETLLPETCSFGG